MTTPAQPEKSAAESCSHSIPLSQPCMECTENETATTRTATHIPVLLRFMAKLVKFCVATETLQDSMSLIAKLATQVLNLRSRLAAATERAEAMESFALKQRGRYAELVRKLRAKARRRYDELTLSRAATDKTRQDADALLAQIPRWRAIESAPKDMTFILGYWSEEAYPHEFVTRYEVVYWLSSDGVAGDWHSAVTGEDILEPTHWMPLPLPPKET